MRGWLWLRRLRSLNPRKGHSPDLIPKPRYEELREFQKKLGFSFLNMGILDQALTHISFANENREKGFKNNELMEFLGDAVLGFLIAEKLTVEFPDLHEGDLSRARSYLVSTMSLARKSEACDLGRFLRLGKGEDLSGGRGKASLLANAFEALICGVYLDRGLGGVRKMITEHFAADFTRKRIMSPLSDYKTRLQEFRQEQWGIAPTYHVASTSGPDHHKRFDIVLKIEGRSVGRGKGYSKKKAEQIAARMALYKIYQTRRRLPKSASSRDLLEAVKKFRKPRYRKTEI